MLTEVEHGGTHDLILKALINSLEELTNGRTLYYPVGGQGRAGESVSGSIHVNGKIKRVSFTGVAYGPGGIQIALPQSETSNFSSGGGSGMSIPNPEILYEK